ncbi:PREDICTED: uncharacterized protein LOC104811493 [Tarenaya hassleriana]|uniref:uncharacterized protein LOC104811493 n=1 Tax=Tarenaya hassleriana TaxID=28532 RepID=UPI00053C6D19|nr:PREDICTED: uncharacterized protein LOC104811493 [Tarenaya hassleriana]
MGRNWYRLGGGNGVKDVNGGGGGGGDGRGREVSSYNSTRKIRRHESRNTHSRNAASGCMAALFQFLDFHHFYFPSHHHHPTIDSLPEHPKGLQPPRNSLELTEEPPFSSTCKDRDREIVNIPMGIRVKTDAGDSRLKLRPLAMETSFSSSKMGTSPGTKTPSLVARLMGLDLLPDHINLNHSSPGLHAMSSHRTKSRLPAHKLSLNGKTTGTRSVPESPRVSSARKSDFDIHRLSLQLNKENKHEEFGFSRPKELTREEESQSPRDYAKQILNQIKERVITRRVGMDITSTVKNREAEPGRKDCELRRNSPISCSPRDRFPEKENKPSINQRDLSPSMARTDQIPQHHKIPPRVEESLKRVKHQQVRSIKRYKEENGETMSNPISKRPSLTSGGIRNKQEEIFFMTSRNSKADCYNHQRNKKKTHVLNDLTNISAPSTVPVKKIPSPATKLPQKQSRGPERSSKPLIRFNQTYKHKEILLQVARNPDLDETTAIAATSTATGGTKVENEYATRILSYTGITDTDSPVSSAKLSSERYPLDLSIFRSLEHSGQRMSGSLSLPCNRRLLFDLVNEIMVGILNPHTKHRRNYNGSELVRKICLSIENYTRPSFPNPEEIDTLFSGNLPETKKAEEGEGEGIVAEIEREIVDALMEETTSDFNLYTTNRNGVVLGRRIKTISF